MPPYRESESPDSSPAPRPNARTSCDLCKRMKIKCERQGETCLHCLDRAAQCETTLVERKKRQVKRVDPGSIVEMENRIKRLEAVIVAAGLQGQSNRESHTETNNAALPDSTNVTDRLSSLVIDEEGNSNFLGSSSGFSIFSPQGLQWISERTGSLELTEFIKEVAKSHKSTKERVDLWRTLPESEREPLPPKIVADQYIKCFFETFNTMLPLYDWDIFHQYYTRQYTADPPSGAAWFASINVVLGIGGMIMEVNSHIEGRGRNKENAFFKEFPDIQNSPYSKYFHNATSCFIDLVFNEPSLMAVQALCGISYLQQMYLEPHPSNVVTAAAGRMAYSIGLHQRLDEFGLSEAEINQRRNVFWIVYIIDKVLALRIGQPGVMNDDDIGVDLPREYNKFSHYPDGSRMYDIFRCQVQLAQLESQVYTELYSAKAHKRSALERLRSVGQLDKDLQDWRLTVPIEVRPDDFIRCSQEQLPPVFQMQFEYFNCVSIIHRASVHHRGPWTKEDPTQTTSSLHNPQLNPRVYSSQAICLAAARSTIKLLQYIDVVDGFRLEKFIWTTAYYPLSAFLLLFANIIYNPEDSSACSDVQLMDLVISVLSPMISHNSPMRAVATLQLLEKLRTVAKTFVANKSLQKTKNTKREFDSDVPKDTDSQPIALFPEPTAAVPQSQANQQPDFMPYVAHPVQANTQQYYPQSLNRFGDGLFVPDAQPTMPLDEAGFPTLGFDAFMFSENFQWDLANLWNKEYSPSAQTE